MADSINKVWFTEKREIFEFLIGRWDVQIAKTILSRKQAKKQKIKVVQVGVKGYFDMVGNPPSENDDPNVINGMRIDWDKAKALTETNLEDPIVIITVDAQNTLVIDGYHRIAKAKLLGRTSLPAVILNKRESDMVRIA